MILEFVERLDRTLTVEWTYLIVPQFWANAEYVHKSTMKNINERLYLFLIFASYGVFSKIRNAPPGRAPPEKASECVVRQRLCRWWAVGLLSPRFSYVQWLKEAVGGLSISHLAWGVKISPPLISYDSRTQYCFIERGKSVNLATYPGYVKLAYSCRLFS